MAQDQCALFINAGRADPAPGRDFDDRAQQVAGQRHRIDGAVQQRPAALCRIKQTCGRIGLVGQAETAAQAAAFADLAALQDLFHRRHQRQEPGPHRLHAEHSCRRCRRGDPARRCGIRRKRLFDQHRLARRNRGQRMGLMGHRRQGDIDRIDIGPGDGCGIALRGHRPFARGGKAAGPGMIARGHDADRRSRAKLVQTLRKLAGNVTGPQNRPACQGAVSHSGIVAQV